MKVIPFVVVAAVCLLVVLGRPHKIAKEPAQGPIQEARQEEEYAPQENEIKVTYEVSSMQEEAIADIIWLKKAAQEALGRGSAYFNVIDQRIGRNEKTSLSVVEGIIQLQSDPMSAQYDAHEISALALDGEPTM